MTIDVILPAGGRIVGEFAAEAGTEVKALVTIGEQTILERTLEAMRATGRVGRIVVIGPDELSDHPSVQSADIVLPEGDTGPENIFRGLEWLREKNAQDPLPAATSPRVLIVTTDLPFITPSAICAFLDACPTETHVCVPIVNREAFESCFPGAPNTYVRLRDGEWTLGCAFLLAPAAILKNRESIERIFAARKSQVGMARLLGLLFIARLFTKQLTVRHIKQRCEQILGCTGEVVLHGAPELAYDVDLIEEYHYALGWKA